MRVLVSPASTHGGTAEIGRRIADVLRRYGIDVDVSQPEHLADLSPYSGFVLGSAIYRGRWNREARDLIDAHQEVIASKPCWLFSSGPMGDGLPTEPLRAGEESDLMATTKAREHRLFGGRLDLDRLGVGQRLLAKAMHVEGGDVRPWDEIDDWATHVAAQLIAGPVGIPTLGHLTDHTNLTDAAPATATTRGETPCSQP